MSTPSILSAETHAHLRLDTRQALRDFDRAQVVRLRVPEVGNAACCFPLFFTRDPQQGHWSLSALTALEPDTNLFVDANGWQGLYVPLLVRTHPVRLSPGDDEPRLAVEERFLGDSGEALYDTRGRRSAYLDGVNNALHEDLEGASITQGFCRHLDELGLIKPINIQLHYHDGGNRVLEGLYTVDQEALATLEDDQQLDLQRRGYLMAVHSLLMSLFQLNRLIRHHNGIEGNRSVQKVALQRRS